MVRTVGSAVMFWGLWAWFEDPLLFLVCVDKSEVDLAGKSWGVPMMRNVLFAILLLTVYILCSYPWY